MTQVVSEVAEPAEAADALAATFLQARKPLVFEKAKWPHELLDVLPAAIYTTDAKGRITYYNDAAVALWGCRPRLNSDQWCGSWRLYQPDGTPLPHDVVDRRGQNSRRKSGCPS